MVTAGGIFDNRKALRAIRKGERTLESRPTDKRAKSRGPVPVSDSLSLLGLALAFRQRGFLQLGLGPGRRLVAAAVLGDLADAALMGQDECLVRIDAIEGLGGFGEQ